MIIKIIVILITAFFATVFYVVKAKAFLDWCCKKTSVGDKAKANRTADGNAGGEGVNDFLPFLSRFARRTSLRDHLT